MDQDSTHHPDRGAAHDVTQDARRDLVEIAGMATDERTARIVLSLGCLPGDELVAQLVTAHGALGLVRRLADGSLQGETMALDGWIQAVTGRLDLAEVSRVLLRTQQLGLGTLIPGDAQWPAPVGDPGAQPLVLWTRGDASLLTSRAPRVAVVGSRFPTEYGTQVTRTIGAGLADRGVTVLGTGSSGIDTTAAVGALVAGGPVIAVLPAGLDRPYPSGSAHLFRRIAADGGVLVSACPPGRITGRTRARVRDRLVAAMADAVVITEAAWRSPVLRIPREAARLGIPVGAVPGPVTSVICGPRHGLPVPDRVRGVSDVSNSPGSRSAGRRLRTPRA